MKNSHNLDQLRGQYIADGFVVVRHLLSGSALQELHAELARYIREIVPHLPKDQAFYDDYSKPETLRKMQALNRHDSWFGEFMSNGPQVPIQEYLMGDKCLPQGMDWFDKLPYDQNPTPAHQDGFYWNRKPDIACGAWIALDAVDRQNACLWYARGSHRTGIKPHGASGVLGFSQGLLDFDAAKVDAVPIELEPGDAVLHSSATIHWTLTNQTDRHRRALATFCFGASTVLDTDGHARYAASLKAQLAMRGITST